MYVRTRTRTLGAAPPPLGGCSLTCTHSRTLTPSGTCSYALVRTRSPVYSHALGHVLVRIRTRTPPPARAHALGHAHARTQAHACMYMYMYVCAHTQARAYVYISHKPWQVTMFMTYRMGQALSLAHLAPAPPPYLHPTGPRHPAPALAAPRAPASRPGLVTPR